MAGLLDDPLYQAIRAQYGGSGGGSGNWDDAGVDRAQELADLLRKAGVTQWGDLAMKETPWDMQSMLANVQLGDQEPDAMLAALNANGGRKQLQIGDKTVGYLGDYNNDGSYGNKAQDYLTGSSPDENLLGWSARGDGNTSYRVVTDPNTGELVISPGWNSSSDAGKAQDLAKGAAFVGASGLGMNALFGPGGLAMGGAAGAGGAGGAGGAAGIGTLPGAASMPMAAAVQPSMASVIGSSALGPMSVSVPSLATAGLGAAGGLGGAGAAASGAGGLLDSVLKYAPVVAGAIGGSQPSGGGETTRQSKMDPRMDPYVYDSYLPALKAQYEKGKTPNENQRKGWDMQLGLLTDPVRMKQLQDMQAAAMARSQSPIAGNPFSNGGATLYQSRRGLLGGG